MRAIHWGFVLIAARQCLSRAIIDVNLQLFKDKSYVWGTLRTIGMTIDASNFWDFSIFMETIKKKKNRKNFSSILVFARLLETRCWMRNCWFLHARYFNFWMTQHFEYLNNVWMSLKIKRELQLYIYDDVGEKDTYLCILKFWKFYFMVFHRYIEFY